MTHALLYNKDKKTIVEVNTSSSNKLSYILVDAKNTDYVCGYDETEAKLKLYDGFSSNATLKSETVINAKQMLDYKVIYFNNNCYFLYSYISKTDFKIHIEGYDIISDGSIYDISIVLDKEYKSDEITTITDIDPNDTRTKSKFYFINNSIKCLIYNNTKLYLLSINTQMDDELDNNCLETVYVYDFEHLDPLEKLSNSFYNVYFPESQFSYNALNFTEEDYIYNLASIPVFITKDMSVFGDNMSSKSILYFIDFSRYDLVNQGDAVNSYRVFDTRKYIFDNAYGFIYKILLSSRGNSELTIRIYSVNPDTGENVLDTFYLEPKSLESKIFVPDTEMVINTNTYNSSAYIKTNAPNGHYPNKNKFFIRDTAVTTLPANTNDENSTIFLNSVDNGQARIEADYSNELKLISNSDRKLKEFLTSILEVSENVDNIDRLVPTKKDYNYKVENRFRTNLFVQEFSKNRISTTIGAVKSAISPDERNTYVVATKNFNPKNNIAIEISGENTNTVSDKSNLSKYVACQADNSILPINKFRDLILPYADILYRKYGIYNIESGDYNIMQSLYYDSITFSKDVKFDSSDNSKNITGTNKFINDLLIFMKAMNYKNLNSRIVGEFFGSNSDQFIYTTEKNKNSIYKYENEYGGYKLNNEADRS